MEHPPTFIEVCAGAGGLSSGFIKNNFTPIMLNDNNKYCIQTLQNNHPNAHIVHDSMTNINFDEYKDKIDVLMGGVPCQSFSQAGKRAGTDDERGGLILHFIKIIETIKPKIFLIENVKGLVSHNMGNTLKNIIQKIDELQLYNTTYKVLNANDYSVPQQRERLIIVGVRNDLNKTFEYPAPHNYKPVLRDVLQNCPPSQGLSYSGAKINLFQQIPQGGCWINLPIEEQKKYLGNSYNSGGGKRGILRRLDMSKPALTLMCTPSQKQTERCHPTENRPLQILEYARIQTFPDDYKFAGSVNQIYKQIGNAVPVNMSDAIAKSILAILDT